MNYEDIRKLQLLELDIFNEAVRICNKNNLKYYMIGGTLLGAVRHRGFIPWDNDLDIAMFREDYSRFIECCTNDLSSKYFLQNYKTDIDVYHSLTRICINNTVMKKQVTDNLRHHKGVFIDIFPLDNVPDDVLERERQRKLLKIIDTIIISKACYIYDAGFLYWKLIIKKIVKSILKPVRLKWLHKIREKIATKYSYTKTEYVCSMSSRYGYKKQILEKGIYGSPVSLEFEGNMYLAPEKWSEYLRHLYKDYMKLPSAGSIEAVLNEYTEVICDFAGETTEGTYA